jgi:plastocyanin
MQPFNPFKLLLASACAALAGRPAAASTIDVRIQNFQFIGHDITISLGDTVHWTNFDAATHTVTQGLPHTVNGSEFFNHNMPSGAQFSLTFDAAFLSAHPLPGNRYDYFCVVHGAGMVGSITVDTGPGSLYCFCAPLPACGNVDAGAGCPNSTGHGGRLMGGGTASIGADDLLLVVDRLPPNKSGLVFRGTAQSSAVVFYDGYLCTSGTLYRFGVMNSGAAGTITQGPGIVALTSASPAPITAGQTWNFQCYYRDLLSPCSHQVNISNGYSVTFAP